jgi:hypothetical protein
MPFPGYLSPIPPLSAPPSASQRLVFIPPVTLPQPAPIRSPRSPCSAPAVPIPTQLIRPAAVNFNKFLEEFNGELEQLKTLMRSHINAERLESTVETSRDGK